MSQNQRALNDYTADKVSPTKNWVEPKKTAFHISSVAPGQSVDLKNKTQSKEVDTSAK